MVNRQLTVFLAIVIASLQSVSAEEILVRTPSGGSLIVNVEPDQSFSSVVQQIEAQVNEIDPIQPSEAAQASTYVVDFTQGTTRSVSSQGRDYYHVISSKEKDDIRYILRTLAKGTWSELLKAKSKLRSAGDRTDKIHPLRYLLTIFTDTELKDAFHCVRGRSAVWSEYYSEFSASLQQESNAGNLQPNANDFANNLKLDQNTVSNLLQQQKWSDFLDYLFKSLPKSGNSGRYES